MASISKFVERMIYWCRDADLGYDQSNRQDFRNGGECDCSSLVIHALQEAGFDTGSASYTGNMSSNLCARGWHRDYSQGYPPIGAICLNDACHVAACVGPNGQLAQASIDENGNITGGYGGDQTGNETNICGFYDYPWDCYLIYDGEEEDISCDKSVRYAAYTQNNNWLPDMINYKDTGGSYDTFAGDGSPILYLAMDFPGWYQVKTENGWLDKVYKFDKNDYEYGCAGDGTPIYAVRCCADTGYIIEYSANDLPKMKNLADTGGSYDDFAGNGNIITKFSAKLVKA